MKQYIVLLSLSVVFLTGCGQVTENNTTQIIEKIQTWSKVEISNIYTSSFWFIFEYNSWRIIDSTTWSDNSSITTISNSGYEVFIETERTAKETCGHIVMSWLNLNEFSMLNIDWNQMMRNNILQEAYEIDGWYFDVYNRTNWSNCLIGKNKWILYNKFKIKYIIPLSEGSLNTWSFNKEYLEEMDKIVSSIKLTQ